MVIGFAETDEDPIKIQLAAAGHGGKQNISNPPKNSGLTNFFFLSCSPNHLQGHCDDYDHNWFVCRGRRAGYQDSCVRKASDEVIMMSRLNSVKLNHFEGHGWSCTACSAHPTVGFNSLDEMKRTLACKMPLHPESAVFCEYPNLSAECFGAPVLFCRTVNSGSRVWSHSLYVL